MRRRNRAEEVVLSCLRENGVGEGTRVCVCFSGGMDSSVLLRTLAALRAEIGFCLSACHFNHHIRGEEADRDETFCRSVCASLGVTLYTGGADVPADAKARGKSLEETARDARYAWFDELGEKEGIDFFATAHHKNDQAETVLFRLLRGTAVGGLCGIPSRRGKYLRPFLPLTRAELRAYAEERGVPYCTDSSNDCERDTRNCWRRTLLPAMEKVDPAVVDSLSRLSRCAAEDEAFLRSLLPPYDACQDVSGLSPALFRRVAARNYAVCTGKTLCFPHLDALCDLAERGRDGVVGLPGGYRALLKGGTLRFERVNPPLSALEPGELRTGVTLLCGGAVRLTVAPGGEKLREICADGEFIYNLSTEFPLSCAGICGMIQYRSRRPGDRLRLRGVNRSVKKLFSESGLPVSVRDAVPLLADAQGVLCVPFVGVADRACRREETAASFVVRVEIAERMPERWYESR